MRRCTHATRAACHPTIFMCSHWMQMTRHDDAPALLKRAIALFQQGKRAEARDLCERVLQITPNHFDAMHLLGVLACKGGELDRGLALLDKAIVINPQAAEV